MLVENQ